MDKKAYETPEAEVMCFGNDDVITASGTPSTTLPPVQAVLLKDYFRQKAHRMRKNPPPVFFAQNITAVYILQQAACDLKACPIFAAQCQVGKIRPCPQVSVKPSCDRFASLYYGQRHLSPDNHRKYTRRNFCRRVSIHQRGSFLFHGKFHGFHRRSRRDFFLPPGD